MPSPLTFFDLRCSTWFLHLDLILRCSPDLGRWPFGRERGSRAHQGLLIAFTDLQRFARVQSLRFRVMFVFVQHAFVLLNSSFRLNPDAQILWFHCSTPEFHLNHSSRKQLYTSWTLNPKSPTWNPRLTSLDLKPGLWTQIFLTPHPALENLWARTSVGETWDGGEGCVIWASVVV